MKSSSVRRRSSVPHCARPQVRGVCHVVLRVRRGLPWLRTPRTYRVLERAFRRGKEKQGFALVQFSVQGDHVHLLIEAESKEELARGLELRERGASDKKAYRVHNRLDEPCPRCGTPIARVDFDEHTIYYCPTCQTEGRILKDRRLSRLLR